jgi:hypothetical protein
MRLLRQNGDFGIYPALLALVMVLTMGMHEIHGQTCSIPCTAGNPSQCPYSCGIGYDTHSFIDAQCPSGYCNQGCCYGLTEVFPAGCEGLCGNSTYAACA